MSESKHTPGPWVIDGLFDADVGVDILAVESTERREDGVKICEVVPFEEDWTELEIANAHLITAAPELFEACRVVTAFLDSLENNTDPADPLVEIRRKVHAPLRAALNSAIAKAEGRS